jgi:ATP-dependent helicase/nuclease subunit A
VDYKTGSQKYSETAFRQLEAYAAALYEMKYLNDVKAIELAVVYPLEKAVKTKAVSKIENLKGYLEELNSAK